MTTRSSHRGAYEERKVDRYEDELMGIPVIIENAVVEYTDADGEKSYAIPDEPQLIASMAVARALMPKKLTGKEIRFMRKAMGLTQKEFADKMEIDPATASRWESDGQALGGFAEKVLRYLVCTTLTERAPGVVFDPKMIADLKIIVARNAAAAEKEEPLTFVRTPTRIPPKNLRQEVWELPKAA